MGSPADRPASPPDSTGARVVVVVPAHDEQDHLPACLDALGTATAHALATGVVEGAHVVVVAHRCTDLTADLARAHAWPPGVTAQVVVDTTSATVGEVRAHGVARAAADRASSRRQGDDRDTDDACSTWLLSTDADSRVPRTWVVDLLATAARTGAVAVAGLVQLQDWAATPQARAAYDRVLAAGMTGPDTHDHAYAANLAVRLDAYRAAGGFPVVAHGEERALLDALRRLGLPVASTRSSVVPTSGRMPGRAAEGLGHLLSELVADPGMLR